VAEKQVHEIPNKESLDCVVCLSIMEDPVVLPGCGHTICSACAEKIRLKPGGGGGQSILQRRCPSCRKPFKAYKPNYFARQLINKEQIYCDYALFYDPKAKCWKKRNPEQLSHNKEEAYPICSKVISIADRYSHRARCPMALVACEYRADGCQAVLTREKQASHSEECPFRCVSCRLCNARVSMKHLHVHLQEECKKVHVSCPFEKYGCEAVDLERCDLATHLSTCRFEQVKGVLEQFEQRIADLAESNIQLARKCQQLELDQDGATPVFVKGLGAESGGLTRVIGVHLEHETVGDLRAKLVPFTHSKSFILVLGERVLSDDSVLLRHAGLIKDCTLAVRMRINYQGPYCPCLSKSKRHHEELQPIKRNKLE